MPATVAVWVLAAGALSTLPPPCPNGMIKLDAWVDRNGSTWGVCEVFFHPFDLITFDQHFNRAFHR